MTAEQSAQLEALYNNISSNNYIMGSEYLEKLEFVNSPLSLNRAPVSILTNQFQTLSIPIDLTGYKYIKIGAHSYGYYNTATIGLSVTKSIPRSNQECKNLDNIYSEKQVGTAQTNIYLNIILDISELTGKYYCNVYTYAGSGTVETALVYWKLE